MAMLILMTFSSSSPGVAVHVLVQRDQRQHEAQQGDARHLPGVHGETGHVPLEAGHRVRHQHGGRRQGRQGRHGAPRAARVQHRQGGEKEG